MSYRGYLRGRGLYRSDDSVLLGVCGGIADHFDFSPWGVRFMFIIVALATAIIPMLLVYVVLAFMMRKAPRYYESRYRDY